jgi:mevalonate kinase
MEAEIHAKLTGAGGGGCVICFPKDPDFEGSELRHQLFEQFRAQGFQVWDKVKASASGLTYKLIH